ncbi:MAG: class I SAM-dependent methyltransferase [Chthoniobacterales bacterium]
MENGDARTRVAARYAEPWLRRYARSKLRTDPVFDATARLLHESSWPLLDLGCGIGLLPFYLRECGFTPPITGVEIDARKIERANAVANGRYEAIEFLHRDVNEALPEFSGNVVLVDLLHYLRREDQAKLLRAIATRVAPGALLLIRDAPRESSLRFCLTYLAEIFAQTITWNVGGPMYFPTRESINDSLGEDFSHHECPMWGGSPFNNRLFIFRRAADRDAE